MEKIIVETRLHDELDELIQKLYDKEYFGFLLTAKSTLIGYITSLIPYHIKKIN